VDSSRRRFLQQSSLKAGMLGALTDHYTATGQLAPGVELPNNAKALVSRFQLKYPIVQAPTAGAAGPELAIEITNAGAMGAISLSTASPERARELVTKVRGATKGPFLVGYLLSFEPRSLAVALDAGAPVLQFSWGLPSKEMVSLARSSKARFGVQVGNAAGARAALDAGADYLVCQGTEAGGHVQSSRPLYDILPEVLRESNQIHVLAAGGIVNGQKIWRALAAGAAGAVLGTRFVATKESPAHTEYKKAVIQAHAKDTVLSVCFQGGWPNATHRAIRNATFFRWEAAGCPAAGKRPGEGDILAHSSDGTQEIRYSSHVPLRSLEGRIAELVMYAGEGVDDIKDLPGARELVARLWAECAASARR
jgi:nitronate monooxygenase